MLNFLKPSSKKAGLPPGTVVHVGERKVEEVRIFRSVFDKEYVEKQEVKKIKECLPMPKPPTATWIHFQGLHEERLFNELEDALHIHPLALEDLLNTGQRPKTEDFDSYILVIAKVLSISEDREIQMEQAGFILGEGFLVSAFESEDGVIHTIDQRMQRAGSRIRRSGPDYLLLAMLDVIVDRYFVVLEALGEEVEAMEDLVVADPGPRVIQRIHRLKRSLIAIRRAVWPLREAIGTLERSDSELISENTRVFLRDLFDHTIQVVETVETLRDTVSGLLDVYLSSVSNRTNEIMKVLTIMATIFIPLTFIAGVYGMNFEHMPELKWKWGYPAALALMAFTALGLLLFFRRKRWL